MPLYEQLSGLAQLQRHNVAGHLIDGLMGTDKAAFTAFWGLCEAVIAATTANDPTLDSAPLRPGEFLPAKSALLVRSAPRVRGFLGAIARAPQAKTIIDGGTGATALLASAAAILHPGAEVLAYELNEPSARCAQAMINLLGLESQVEIRNQDIMTTSLPAADLAITETFAAGLFVEQGIDIARRLAGSAASILPARILLNATDQRAGNGTIWQPAANIDLSSTTDRHITGQLASTGSGPRLVSVHAAYFDAHGIPILIDPTADNLTKPVPLGTVSVPQAGDIINFSYQAGADPHEPRPTLWVGE